MLGHPAQVSGRITYVPIGELGQGETRELFVELAIAGGRKEGAVIELADAVLSFEDAVGSAGRLERRAFASVRASGDEAAIAASGDSEVVRGVERARAAAATVQVIATARSGRLDEARRMLDRAMVDTRRKARELDDPELAGAVREMEELRSALPSLVEKPRPQAASGAAAPENAPAVVKRAHARAVEALQR